MAPIKKVPSLQELGHKAVESLVTVVCKYAIDDERVHLKSFSADFGVLLKEQTCRSLHERIAKDFLLTLEKALKHYSAVNPRLLPKCQNVVKHLVTVIPLFQLKEINILDYEWSEVVYSSLISLLDRMPSLKKLDVSTNIDSWEHCPLVEQLADTFHLLSNLTSFDFRINATDSLIAELCSNCKGIREIIVAESDNISDRSIPYLIKCKNLQIADVGGTSVTPEGYFDLLTKSKSDLLDIGKIYIFPLKDTLNLLEKKLRPFRTFGLQRLILGSGLSTKELRLVARYFPHLKELSLEGNSSAFVPSCFSKLKNLTQLSFQSEEDITNQLCSLFSARGQFITSLCLDFCFEMKGKSFVDIAKSCPNIESLEFFGDLADVGPNFLDTVLPEKPFQKLKIFRCDLNISLSYLKFVLCNASNIQDVDLKTDSIIDEFFESVFQLNPLKQLKSLKIQAKTNRISAKMLKCIIIHCDEISSLIYLGSTTVVTKTDVKRLRAYVAANNYDLDLTGIDPVMVDVARLLASM